MIGLSDRDVEAVGDTILDAAQDEPLLLERMRAVNQDLEDS
jgi:hypothetical protein